MAGETIFVGKKAQTGDTFDVSAISGLFSMGTHGVDALGGVFHKLIDLAKTNPLWGTVLGLVVADMLSHKVDLVKWTHEELICADCAVISPPSAPTAPNPLINLLPTPLQFIFQPPIGTYSQLLDTHAGHTVIPTTFSGIITGATATTISVLIVAAMGIAGAGEVIGDITKLTNVAGSTASAESIIKPSVTTLVESGDRPVGVGITPK